LEFSGISDREVIQIAIEESRTIITFDRDYGELIFKYGYRPAHGVIYLRWKHYKPEDPGRYLVSLFKECEVDFLSALTVIGDDSIRQRKYRI
jgi:predicted nuclease of predicted toxin-antitoxin system